MTGSSYKVGLVMSLIDRLSGPAQKVIGTIAKFEGQVERAQEKMNGWGDKLQGTGTKMTIASAASGAALFGLTRPLVGVDKASRNLETVVTPMFGSMEADIERVTQAARAWQREHLGGAAAFIESSYGMVSAGLSTKEAIEGTRQATAMAIATSGQASEAADYLATVYKNVGDRAADVGTEMQRLADITARTQQFHQLRDLQQLTEGMKYAIPQMKIYGMTLEQTSAAVGTLNDAGITGGQAGTMFAAMMRQMNKASGDLGFTIARTADGGVDLVGTLEAIQAKFGDQLQIPDTQEAMKKAFGDEGLMGLMSLLDKTQQMRASMDALASSAGTVAKAQAVQEKGIGARFTILWQNLQDAMLPLAEKLVPLVEKLVPRIVDLVQGFTEFVEKNPKLVEMGMHFWAISTAVGAIGGPLLTMAGGLLKVLATGLGLRRVTALLGGISSIAGKSAPAALDAMAGAGEKSAGRMMGAFGKVFGILMQGWLLWKEFQLLGDLGRGAAGMGEAKGAEHMARKMTGSAQKLLANPEASAADREKAERLMSRAGWKMARAQDYRREVAAGSYLASEQFLPDGLTGVNQTPADAPRNVVRMTRHGDLVSTEVAPFDVPLGGRAAKDERAGAPGSMQVEDPEQQRRLDALIAEVRRGNEKGERPINLTVTMPNGESFDLQTTAREAAY